MSFQCNGCNDEVYMIHRHPDGQRFCGDCWRKHQPKPEERMKYNVCVSCRTVGNIGGWVDAQTFVCDACATDPNGNTGDIRSSGEVIKLPQAAIHESQAWHHIALKLKGNARAVAFFHFAISSVDADWPWKDPERKHEHCSTCGGVGYRNPIIDCEDIKKIAKACGVGKCKIKYWGEACA